MLKDHDRVILEKGWSKVVLTEVVEELKEIYEKIINLEDCKVKQEFFMPAEMHKKIDLNHNYWKLNKKMIEEHGGILESWKKQVYHL